MQQKGPSRKHSSRNHSAASSTSAENTDELTERARQIERAGRQAARKAHGRALEADGALHYVDRARPGQIIKKFPGGRNVLLEDDAFDHGKLESVAEKPGPSTASLSSTRAGVPTLTLVAGPNGAGKSSLTPELTSEGGLLSGLPVIDPDRIARDLRPELPQKAAFAAGRAAIRRAKEYLECGESFVIETTFSGQRGLRLLSEAKERGFKAQLIFVGLRSVHLAKKRVAQRVKEGGHHVPEEAVERRYYRGLARLREALPETSERTSLITARRRDTVPSWPCGRAVFELSLGRSRRG